MLGHRRDGVERGISKKGEVREDERMKETGNKRRKKGKNNIKTSLTYGWNLFS